MTDALSAADISAEASVVLRHHSSCARSSWDCRASVAGGSVRDGVRVARWRLGGFVGRGCWAVGCVRRVRAPEPWHGQGQGRPGGRDLVHDKQQKQDVAGQQKTLADLKHDCL